MTKDEVRDRAKVLLGFHKTEDGVKQGTGHLTTSNRLGITGEGKDEKLDGWYLPEDKGINKSLIYTLTARITNCLHTKFGVKDLYHRMIFTACALVAERYGARLAKVKDMGQSLPYGRLFLVPMRCLFHFSLYGNGLDRFHAVFP